MLLRSRSNAINAKSSLSKPIVSHTVNLTTIDTFMENPVYKNGTSCLLEYRDLTQEHQTFCKTELYNAIYQFIIILTRPILYNDQSLIWQSLEIKLPLPVLLKFKNPGLLLFESITKEEKNSSYIDPYTSICVANTIIEHPDFQRVLNNKGSVFRIIVKFPNNKFHKGLIASSMQFGNSLGSMKLCHKEKNSMKLKYSIHV